MDAHREKSEIRNPLRCDSKCGPSRRSMFSISISRLTVTTAGTDLEPYLDQRSTAIPLLRMVGPLPHERVATMYSRIASLTSGDGFVGFNYHTSESRLLHVSQRSFSIRYVV